MVFLYRPFSLDEINQNYLSWDHGRNIIQITNGNLKLKNGKKYWSQEHYCILYTSHPPHQRLGNNQLKYMYLWI